jgi:hypothetical protein
MVAVGQQLVKNHGGDLSDCRYHMDSYPHKKLVVMIFTKL